ncbi:glucosamine 6-phosphate synthetase [Ureibacillus sp. 179-F W5.1 NHS]|uniref:glucosamine 6-phosphate synthetase n=1 Tax=unclassified Ureibacillus TaxID=2638520 RepID=UPI003119E509
MQNVSKRTILWIVPILIIAIFWYFYGPQEEITDNEYITYIKEKTINETSNQTFDQAFSNHCKEGKWVYFKTQRNQHVVEYKGSCDVEGKLSEVNLQYVVEDDQKDYQIGVLLLDGEQQSEKIRDDFIQHMAIQ